MSQYFWYDLGNGRQVYRKAPEPRPEPSHLGCPRIVRDFDQPVQSMADGKWYTSKAALAASHKASGNPHGIDFIELGNETPQFQEHVPDAGKRREDVRQALNDVVTGNLPPEIAAIE
ncbi:hypothetical protein [Devosia nitrariae]|uniref:Uncharacterized protein n=1 Tax=Devosia nitrariae TaxID=2071872 RepID=A0ABQ5W1G3_9HYPH|nr:hypothetical protein [Devosia nitrariae]GLQ53760.1 hypothetical protein GCM10010862_10190 [Devosia nitrariae]